MATTPKWDLNAATLLALIAALVSSALWIQAQTTVEPLRTQYSEVLTEVRAMRKDLQELTVKFERTRAAEEARREGR